MRRIRHHAYVPDPTLLLPLLDEDHRLSEVVCIYMPLVQLLEQLAGTSTLNPRFVWQLSQNVYPQISFCQHPFIGEPSPTLSGGAFGIKRAQQLNMLEPRSPFP